MTFECDSYSIPTKAGPASTAEKPVPCACLSKSGSLAAASSWNRQSREEKDGHCVHPRLPRCSKPAAREISLGKGSEVTMGSLRDFFFFFAFKFRYILNLNKFVY